MVIKLISFAAFSIFMLGIADAEPPSKTKPNADTSANEQKKPAELKNEVPVVESVRFKRFGDPSFSKEQRKQIEDAIAETYSSNDAIWFIYARRGDIYDGKQQTVATIYLKPHTKIGRLWKGDAIYVSSRWNDIRKQVRMQFAEKSVGDPADEKFPKRAAKLYCYVVPDGASAESHIPKNNWLPFRANEGFSDDEVLEIADFVHAIPVRTQKEIVRHAMEKGEVGIEVDKSLPIYRLERDGEQIKVWTGTVEGLLSGAGQILVLKRDAEGKFKLESVGMWVS